MRVVVVVVGGDTPSLPADLPSNAWVIGVDSGVGHALRLGLQVHEAIGDFDSIAPGHLQQITRAGAIIERHSPDKDATDLELALDAAIQRQPSRIMVVGGHGGRLDHFLANLLILSSPSFAAWPIEAHMGDAIVNVIHRQARFTGKPGDLLSLLPMHGDAHGVTTKGLKYQLRDESLDTGTTRGISNVFQDPIAHVSLRQGHLIAIRQRNR